MNTNAGLRVHTVSYPTSDLDDLADRLARTRWPVGFPDHEWSRGVPIGYLQALVERWRSRFDWRDVEAELNRHQPTLATVDGNDYLVLHAVSPEADALPLVLLHGYPSSAVEFLDVIGPLSDPTSHGGDRRDAFHVIVPFLPGFGLAPRVNGHGWTTAKLAAGLVEIMDRLGYSRYGVQGGDVGAGVAQDMAVADPDGVVGIHVVTDMLAAAAVRSFVGGSLDPGDFAERDRPLVERMIRHVDEGLGYLALLGTRPATVSYAIEDSPAGLLAWIAEKFEEWGDLGHEGLSRTLPPDRLLANVTAYWLGRNAVAAAHLLYDARHADRDWGAQPRAPQGWAVFGGGGGVVRQLMDPQHEISHWTEYAEGGHFAALEAPESFVRDVRTFFRQ